MNYDNLFNSEGLDVNMFNIIFVLGINYTDNNVWAERPSWEFANGFRIMDFHFNKWAST